MKILVTGGIGNVGTAVIARLSGNGHEVTVIGRRPGMTVPGARYRSCDITDVDALVEVTKGHDAVVHLAAFGNPALGTPDVIFQVNCQGTMNVYEAASRCGIRRVVTASSINALGYGFGVKEWSYQYFPVDEDHPTFATDAYSFSKNIVEEIGRFWWRRDGISGTCLRLPAVATPPGSGEESIRSWTGCLRSEFEALKAMPAAERARTLDDWMARLARARELRVYENPINPGFTSDIPLMTARQDLWTAVDDRDAAQGIEKSLTDLYFTLPFDLGIIEARNKYTVNGDLAKGKIEEYGKIFVGEPYEVDREVCDTLGLKSEHLDLIKSAKVELES